MAERWFESLRPLCKEASVAAGSAPATDTVLFYFARWCQKKSGEQEPRLELFDRASLGDTAERIVGNLAEDGARVERLVEGDTGEWRELEGLLVASARPRAGEAARQHADEALQKIAVVLLTGTPPSRAAGELSRGPTGPRNEYVFHAPFSYWARSVVIRLVIDEHRRTVRDRRARPVGATAKRTTGSDPASLRAAHAALPGLVDAIGKLPAAQRSVMVMSLARPDVDELARERLHELAPDLFSGLGDTLPSSDAEIAERLDSTPRRVAANRSVARRKLAQRDPRWELLLDALLPHASTRPMTPIASPDD
jgi:hypothetical protein